MICVFFMDELRFNLTKTGRNWLVLVISHLMNYFK